MISSRFWKIALCLGSSSVVSADQESIAINNSSGFEITYKSFDRTPVVAPQPETDVVVSQSSTGVSLASR